MPTLDSTLLAQYQSVRETVGLLDYSSRGKIRVSGPDHVSFLHSMISNDVRELEEWRGRYATFLTPRGKMVCDFYFYKLPDFVLIDLDSSLLSRMMETLGKFIIMDDVSLEDASQDWGHLSLQGPRSGELIRRLVEIETPHEDLQVVALSWRGQSGWLVRRNELGPM
ncbi:MAG: YgfZ/GcvT domain-containing protein, partial [Acidobacteriota bacterium]